MKKIICTILLLISGVALSAEFSFDDSGLSIIKLDGEIRPGDANKFMIVINQAKEKLIKEKRVYS